MRALLLLVGALILTPFASLGAPAISCHCFRDREYDSSRPAAADPYILATSQSSLLSAAFGIDKREVVQARMTGTSAEDLWVARWAASKGSLDASRLLEAKAAKGSWPAAFASLGVDGGRLGAPAAPGTASDAAWAARIADEVLVSRLHARAEAVKSLRDRGATTPETILACLLAPRARRAPSDLYAEVKAGRRSWGEVLSGLGLVPKDIEPEIRRALR